MRHTRLILAAVLAAAVAAPLAGTNAFAAGTPALTLIAGNGTYGPPTPGPATGSDLADPEGLVENSAGDLYVADYGNHVVEEITPSGTLSVVAGTGADGPATPGPATSSDLGNPYGLALDSSGDLFIADEDDSQVYEVTPGGTLSVVAGTGASGMPTAGPAASSALQSPAGLAVNAAGDVYFSDASADEVLEVTPAGTLSIVAGTGSAGLPTPGPATSSELHEPGFLALDAAGDLYVSDYDNEVVEEITPAGMLSIVAGVAGSPGQSSAGPATSSDLDGPTGLAVDSSGDLLIANFVSEIGDEVTPGGTLSLVPVIPDLTAPINGGIGFTEGGPRPRGLVVDPSGALYFTMADERIARYGVATPGAPTDLSQTRIDTAATVTFTPPSDWGTSAISGYQVSLDGGNTWQSITSGGTSPLTTTLTGLNQTAAYTVEIEAINSSGAGAASAALSIPALPATPTPTPTPTPAPTPTPTPQPPAPSPAPQPGRFTATAKGATARTLAVTAHLPAAGIVTALATEADKGNNAGLPSARAASVAAPMPAPGYRRFAYAAGSARSGSAGVVSLTLKLTPAGRAIIARHHNHGWTLHVRVTVLYTSSSGAVQAVTLPMIEIFGRTDAARRASTSKAPDSPAG